MGCWCERHSDRNQFHVEHKIQTMTDKETLERKLLTETNLLSYKTTAMAKVYRSMLESFAKTLEAPETESALTNATELVHQFESMADTLNNAKYELRRYADRVENLECELINLSE